MKVQRSFSAEIKFEVVRRYLEGERASLLAKEFSIRATLVHQWVSAYRREGSAGLRGTGRPSRSARLGEVVSPAASDELADPLVVAERKIALLEQKLARQSLALDFFKDALPLLERSHRAADLPGVTMSTPSSTGGHRGKAKD